MPKRFHLGIDLSYAHMGGRWRDPRTLGGHVFPDVALYEEVARIAERGCLDFIFSGDGTGVPDTWRGSRDAALEWGINWPRQDFGPLAVAMARATKHVGLGLTFSTSFLHPYHMARYMNAMDHVSGGRMAMNLVASTRLSDFANFGLDALTNHEDRYARMEEFVEVCHLLWDSVEPDAMLWDLETGRVTDPAKVHDVDYQGKFFKVAGPLNTPPSPQGRPVLIQAGGSPRGIRASAKVADVIFGGDMVLAQQIRQREMLDEACREIGRDPEQCGILWQTPISIAETEKEAVARKDALLTSIPPEAVGAYLSYNVGYDFSTLPRRFKLAELQAEIVKAQASPAGIVHKMMVEFGAEAELTRDEFLKEGVRYATYHVTMLAGTGAQIADRLEETFEATGSRGGFMLAHTSSLLQDLNCIVDFLVPELQRRGRFRTEYRTSTLRETLAEA
jgi:FMN-dependent oxidoreductase (nitrilotriacetate monooxygenase family)